MHDEFTEEGKRYCEVTEEELKELPTVNEFYLYHGKKVISPPDCKHDFVIVKGLPRNIKECRNCIYWEFTMEFPTK